MDGEYRRRTSERTISVLGFLGFLQHGCEWERLLPCLSDGVSLGDATVRQVADLLHVERVTN